MNREENVIKLDWICSSGKSSEIFFLEKGRKVKTCIEDCIKRVTHKIERQKVKAQPNYGFSFVVDDHLRIEGHRPCHEVNPSYGMRNINYGTRVRDDNSEEEIEVIDDAAGTR